MEFSASSYKSWCIIFTHLSSNALDFLQEYLQGSSSVSFFSGSSIFTPSVLGSFSSNASPLRALAKLVFPARSWPIKRTLTRLS